MTVKDWWQTYRGEVVPPDAGAVQVKETEKAFYAGAIAMMAFAEALADHGDADEADVMAKAIHDELMAFTQDRPTPPRVAEPASYNVRSQEIESVLKEMGRQIKGITPKGWGFMVMLFSHGKTGLRNEGPAGSMFYLSSAEREDMIKAMQEFIALNRH